MKSYLFLLFLSLFIISCGNTVSSDDPCFNVTCSNHGECTNNHGEPWCICESTEYENSKENCIFKCYNNSHVNDTNDGCVCDEGFEYKNEECIATNPCDKLVCDDNQHCEVVDNLAVCKDIPAECNDYKIIFDNNLTGTDMLRELHNITSANYRSLGYSAAKEEMFGYLDNENGQVRGVYTGKYFSNQEGTMPNQNILNCEHTWPQSQFDRDEPMKSDLHHLFPADAKVNSSRSHHPFANISDPDKVFGTCNTNSDYCSKLKDHLFEPADQHKGNVARAMFYFAVRYGNLGSSEYPKFLDAANQKETFLQWNINDPIDQKEIDRNNAIFLLQHNRNPFVDCPILLERVNSSTEFPVSY